MSRKRKLLPIIRPIFGGCPPRPEHCTRCGCRWWTSTEAKESGTLVLGGKDGGLTLPAPTTKPKPRTNAGIVDEDDLIERASAWVARRARSKISACAWPLIMASKASGGMPLHEIGAAIGESREAVRLVVQAALRKLESALASEGTEPTDLNMSPHSEDAARARRAA